MFFLSSLNVYTYMYVFIISTLHFETGKSKIAPFCLLLQHALLCHMRTGSINMSSALTLMC